MPPLSSSIASGWGASSAVEACRGGGHRPPSKKPSMQGGRNIVTDHEPGNIDRVATDPRPSSVAFVTTEHFTLQGARAATISEATGRATMFLGAVSGGLVALGLTATASAVGAAFYAFGLILLPTLAFVGLVTFDRVLQSGIEDHGYARRIARLRGYYFQYAPELVDHLLSV